ncbi:MAG: monovalent cation/H+ antiporter subunit D family protein [Hyphomonadaceae bacterium]
MNAFASISFAPDFLAAHAIVLLAIGPLIAGCAAALAPGSRSAWLISIAGSAFSFWMALEVAHQVAVSDLVVYAMGGFEPPYGITFRADGISAVFSLLISFIATLSALYSGHSLNAEVLKGKHTLFQAGFLLCLAGLQGMVSTGDAFNAFVFLEISSIGTYALIGVGEARDRRALPAAFNYLIMGTIGATFYVIGVGFLYAATGTLNLADLAERIPLATQRRTVEAGFAFIVVGLGLKAAMFPLHGWLPGAYAYSPSLINVFLSATATKAALYLIIRFSFDVFGPVTQFIDGFMQWLFAPLAAAAAIVCSAQAIFQTEIRRMLAFSSVAQVGLIMLGVASLTGIGLAGGMMHLMAHSIMKAMLFMAIGGVTLKVRGLKLADFAGAGRAAPWTMIPFAIGALSLAGVPLTFGFLSKWRLIQSMLETGNVMAVVAIAVASFLTLIYCGRMLETVFFRYPRPGARRVKEAPVGALIPLWILALATVYFGIDGRLPDALAHSAASAVVGAIP